MGERFALLVHPSRSGRKSRRPALPDFLWSCIAPLKTAPLSGISSSFGQVRGRFLFFRGDAGRLVWLEKPHLARAVFRAAKKAARMGARIIGFSPSLAAALGDVAAPMARKLGLTLTGGMSYTAAAAMEGLQRAAALRGLQLEEAAVLVVGAAGPVGAVCTEILARDGANYITLVDEDSPRLELLSRRLLYECGVACRVSLQLRRAAARSDLVIAADRPGGAALSPQDLKAGAILCNLGGADELSLALMRQRPDVMVFDEVVVRLPGAVTVGYDLGLPEGCVSAWMAEAVLWALEGRCDRYFLGWELRVAKVAEMGRLAAKHGFTLVGFRVADRYLDLAAVKKYHGPITHGPITPVNGQ